MQEINTQRGEKLEKAVETVRIMLSTEPVVSADLLISLGYLEKMMEFMQPERFSKHIVHNASWAVSNILAQGNSVPEALKHSLAHSFAKLLYSSDVEYVEISLWGIANLYGDESACKELRIEDQIYSLILSKYSFILSNNLIEYYGFCLRNILCIPPCTSKSFLFSGFEISCDIISRYSNLSYLIDYLYIIHFISSEYFEVIPKLLTLPILDILLTPLSSPNLSISELCLKILGNIATEDHEFTSILLNKGLLSRLVSLFYSSNSSIRIQIVWIISNIAAGTSEQIDLLLEESILVSCMRCISDSSLQLSREVSYIFYNLAVRANDSQMLKCIKLGVVEYLKEGLSNEDTKTLMVRDS